MSRNTDPRTLGAVCSKCPFAINGKPVNWVLGEVPPSPIGVLVGEGPGREEVECKRPFVGNTGRVLDEELLRAGLLRHKLAVVNATCCKPPSNKTEHMMRKAVKCCRRTVLTQLENVPDDTPTLAMGKWAYFALTLKDKGVMNARGFVRREFRIPRRNRAEGKGEAAVAGHPAVRVVRKLKGSSGVHRTARGGAETNVGHLPPVPKKEGSK